METFGIIIGYAAAVCMILGYLPQAITTIRTRDTEGIAMPTFLMMGLGSLFFVIQGIIQQIWSVALANTITLACSGIIFSIKIMNDRKNKRGKRILLSKSKTQNEKRNYYNFNLIGSWNSSKGQYFQWERPDYHVWP